MKKRFRKISVIIPCFNEKNTILEIISRVNNVLTPGLVKEIIVVDDGSDDGTSTILARLKVKNLKVVYHKKNKGKGASVKTGFESSTGDLVLLQDADLEYSPEEYPILLKPIIDGDADVVYGSRFISNYPHRVLYFWHSVGNMLLTTLSNIFTNMNLSDMESGYKIFTREIAGKVLPHIQSKRFGFEPEVTAKLAKLNRSDGVRIYEVGISYRGRTYGEGKKINWKDGILAIWYILKFNLFS